MNKEDFSNLDPKNFGNWPIPVKAVIIIVLCVAVLSTGYWFDTQNQMASLVQFQTKEGELKKTFEKKQKQAATLPKLKEQQAQIDSILKELLRKLPSDAQVDDLIRDIAQAVLRSGLKQELFKPNYGGKKTEKGIYVKLPITLRVKGDYHAIGKFVSDVAAMHRIVTLHNVSITAPASKKGIRSSLTLNMTAQIYQYLDEQQQKKGKKKR
ncbi:MAG: pilus assembly protein PilO [Candidatus Parabeggiatoa sp. nov. 1]|nr:MAG: pilus assembly protein PilO [Gammaproteobacteria bacterium]